jgi:CRP-like cAMP-binding protein
MLDVLAQVSVFNGVPTEALARLLEHSKTRTFKRSGVIMQQGDPADCMHVILDGRVLVELNHAGFARPLALAELGSCELIGEMGVLDGEPRSATVTAIEDTRTLELGRDALVQLVIRYPEVARSLLRLLSQRLRSTDDLVEQLRQQTRN